MHAYYTIHVRGGQQFSRTEMSFFFRKSSVLFENTVSQCQKCVTNSEFNYAVNAEVTNYASFSPNFIAYFHTLLLTYFICTILTHHLRHGFGFQRKISVFVVEKIPYANFLQRETLHLMTIFC